MGTSAAGEHIPLEARFLMKGICASWADVAAMMADILRPGEYVPIESRVSDPEGM